MDKLIAFCQDWGSLTQEELDKINSVPPGKSWLLATINGQLQIFIADSLAEVGLLYEKAKSI